MILVGTVLRGLAAAALATGLAGWAPPAQAERFDLAPTVIFNENCFGSSIGCETTKIPLTLGGISDDVTFGAHDPDNASNDVRVNPNDNPSTVALTAIPEPSTWALLLVCFAGLAFAGLRKRRRERFTL